MNKVEQKFNQLQQDHQKAFIPYIMGGDPDLATTARLIELLVNNGADIIEVGVPFSDPLADGPVIQQAAVRALQNGCTLTKLFNTLEQVNRKVEIPVVLMIYYNMIFQRGIRRFFEEVKNSGCAGLIIPDLPPDEAGEVCQVAAEYEIGLSFLVAPNNSTERIKIAAAASTGFVYAVSLKGVTGMRDTLPPELPEFIRKVKSLTEKPVGVGFGISTPEQAALVAKLADGVIVGSAVVKAIVSDPNLEAVAGLIKGFKAGM